ncbi:NAD-dependent epimerase/dehydratase family protein [Desulfurococcus sp.]|uniref:NAD-dependent epimerase/dehydratase family protein n=1 Tax=Desulfurococcus sp. TaxID=51678 RepID=UPI00319EB2A9
MPIVRADVRKYDGYDGIDMVIHAAAYVSVEESIRDPIKYLENNVLGTAKVSYECGKRGIKLVYLSSAAVYGEPQKLPIGEDHPTRPLSPYGLSKLQGEEVLKVFASTYGLKYIILRLFNVYGPGQSSSYAGVVTVFLEKASRGEPLVIYGDGAQTRDFVYIEDVAEVIESIAREEALNNEVFNIGSGKPTTIEDLAKTIMKLLGRELPIVRMPQRPGDITHSVADISKIVGLTQFKPTPLEEGLKKTLSELKTYSTPEPRF